jgi:segregation and condensation protein A
VAEEVFQGPLHLLLHLAERGGVDLGRISLARLTGAYLAALERATAIDLDAVGAFVAMAARLMRLKALRSPAPEAAEIEAEAAIVRDMRRLERVVADARFLAARQLPFGYRRPWRGAVGPRSARLEELAAATRRVARRRPRPPVALPPPSHRPLGEIVRELRRRLAGEGRLVLDPRELPPGERAATVLAALILAHQGRAALTQPAPFAPLELARREGSA